MNFPSERLNRDRGTVFVFFSPKKKNKWRGKAEKSDTKGASNLVGIKYIGVVPRRDARALNINTHVFMIPKYFVKGFSQYSWVNKRIKEVHILFFISTLEQYWTINLIVIFNIKNIKVLQFYKNCNPSTLVIFLFAFEKKYW